MFFLLYRLKGVDKIIQGNYQNYVIDKLTCEIMENKNALSSVESRVFVDTISSEEANRARAFVIRSGGAPHIKGLGMLVVLLRGVNSLF